MTKTAMNNNQRTKSAVKNNKALVTGFKKFGYQLQVGPWSCAACKDELLIAAQSVGYTGDTPPWGNATIALKFKKGKVTIAACKCGWRKNITIKSTNYKRQCATEDCSVVLTKGDPNSICFKCREAQGVASAYETTPPKHVVKTQGQGVDPVKTCNRANCSNPVPVGRTAVCYSCQPTAKEPVSSGVYM